MVMKSDYEDGYFGFFTARITGGKLAIDKREIEDAEWFAIKDIKKMSLMKATKKFYEKF
jgi:NADH pyrophosphatase NudC (nudix superfamily)